MTERDESSAGQPIALLVGHPLKISLFENASTGFRWQLRPACSQLLHLQSDETAPAATGALGAPRRRTWLFSAIAEGHCDLRFESLRAWEKNAHGKVVSFPVNVRPRS